MSNSSEKLAEDRVIAQELRLTWPAFFQRFGRLTDVQRAAIPVLLKGADALVASSTASGKTEAACAPIIERCKREAQGRWSILYISPTRALVNDLFERLQAPLESLNVRLMRRTGEYKTETLVWPHVLITTPESFDSMMCRRCMPSGENGHLLAYVKAIVLDELHLLHGGPRGEQVRWLLRRLRRLRRWAMEKKITMEDTLQCVALSATVKNPDVLVRDYLVDGKIINVAGGRSIESIELPESKPTEVEECLPRYVDTLKNKPEKILVFSNARARVDALAMKLSPELEQKGWHVHAHHGSLDKRIREKAEETIKQEQKVILFSTSTLELGVDIGDIDLVVLDGPPPDIAAMLQRIGRGNRRTDKTRVMLCATDMHQLTVMKAMLEAAKIGWLGDCWESGPQYAVARQQILSYVFQSPKNFRERGTIEDLFNECCPDIDNNGLIDMMIGNNDIDECQSRIRIGTNQNRATETGAIHSTIESCLGVSVIDVEAGVVVHGLRDSNMSRLNIAGSHYETLRGDGYRLEVRKMKHGSGEELPIYISKPFFASSGPKQALRRYLAYEEEDWPTLQTEGWTYFFHFGGNVRAALLNLFFSVSKETKGIVITDWSIKIPGNHQVLPACLEKISAAAMRIEISKCIPQLEKLLARPRANEFLPLNLRRIEVEGWLQIDRQLKLLSEAKAVKLRKPDHANLLLGLNECRKAMRK